MVIDNIGHIVSAQKNIITIELNCNVEQFISDSSCEQVALRFIDKRVLSDEQRKRIFAIIGDMSDWCCCDKEYARQVMTSEFCFEFEVEPFSLSSVDKLTARCFIKYLVEFCIRHGVPCKNPMYSYCDDIQHMMYCCLLYKRCAVCGRDSEFHHCTGSRSGMGRKSVEIPLVGLDGMALCRKHHDEIHADAEQVFYKRYHVEPVVVDEKLATKYPHYANKKAGD